jgi:hypothetical protein
LDCVGGWIGAGCAGACEDDGPVESSEGSAGVVGTGTSALVDVAGFVDVLLLTDLWAVPAPAT